ncbi:NADH-quinone oxidoreductase subunit N [Symmachiella dynata]|uniref:NADH-quinone oxidoreductase subunit N n=1 Tax=Symmachiella dynata TaxID=2527995 RepID=A0A517ZTU2_9PLAN|nr:NADH-quinone oxidoreductase subunit N [Symmachiella dynata]QDT50171.1 NADH-quinone oxidoreductase subunit N [Symmachiella dynata]QDU45898.1 NADH-quinone oxidoreductase subunit N [Symmachiella dynata]
MNIKIENLVNHIYTDTGNSLWAFSPELAVCATILLLLFARLFNVDRKGGIVSPAGLTMIGIVTAIFLSVVTQSQLMSNADGVYSQELFTGLLVFDPFTGFFRLLLLAAVFIVVWLTLLSGIPDREDGPDFYILLMGATLGMMMMASANHMLMLFLAIETTSVPSYVMVGFLKGRKTASEAALKYVVYGGGAAGVMLYGISLLSGMLGTAYFPDMAMQMAKIAADPNLMTGAAITTLTLAVVMILIGLAFKLSIFPFHFWCPDAFEGASAEVAGFLSVASKAAAFALLVRFCLALVGGSSADDPEALQQFNMQIGVALGFVAAITATFGNLSAYSQTNMKRLLAYSTIAHAGYMLMAVSAMMVFLNAPGDASTANANASLAIEGLLYYLVVYVLMNLGAFGIVALIRNEIYSEEIADYAGMSKTSPMLAVGMLICLFSLVGIPPTGGFIGKFVIFAALFDAAQYQPIMYAVFLLGVLNTVFSLFYYLNVLRVMWIVPAQDSVRIAEVPLVSKRGAYVAFLAVCVMVAGTIFIAPVYEAAEHVSVMLFSGIVP